MFWMYFGSLSEKIIITIDSLFGREWKIKSNNFHVANILVLDLKAGMYMWVPAVLGYVMEGRHFLRVR